MDDSFVPFFGKGSCAIVHALSSLESINTGFRHHWWLYFRAKLVEETWERESLTTASCIRETHTMNHFIQGMQFIIWLSRKHLGGWTLLYDFEISNEYQICNGNPAFFGNIGFLLRHKTILSRLVLEPRRARVKGLSVPFRKRRGNSVDIVERSFAFRVCYAKATHLLYPYGGL